MDKREKAVRKWFKRMDQIVFLNMWDKKRRREKWKEVQETKAIGELALLLKVHHCGALPRIDTSSNFEYPDSIYVRCSCGMKTIGFVEFVTLNPIQPNSKSYSKLESVKKAVLVWNNNYKGIS